MAKVRENHEGTIRLRSDGRYEVRVSVPHDVHTGKSRRISKYAKTKEEAVKILNELTFLYDTKPRTFERCTLGQWLNLCLEVYLRPGIKQSTYLSYESYIRNHLGPVMGEIQLKDITPRMLQMFYNHKQAVEGLISISSCTVRWILRSMRG